MASGNYLDWYRASLGLGAGLAFPSSAGYLDWYRVSIGLGYGSGLAPIGSPGYLDWYRVSLGLGYGAYVPTPGPPVAPTVLTAIGVNENMINLGWARPSTLNEIGYYIFRSTDGLNFQIIAQIGVGSLYSDSTVNPSITYYYYIIAFNTYGDSPPSNVASAETQPAPCPATYPYQTTPINYLFNSISTLLQLYTGFDPSKIREWYGDEEFPYPGEQFISFRITEFKNNADSGMWPGANRLYYMIDAILEVRVYTKLAVDQAGIDVDWFRNQSLGAYQQILNIWDALSGQKIFLSYDSAGNPTGPELITVPLAQIGAKFGDKDENNPSWGINWIRFLMTMGQPIGQTLCGQ